MHALLLGVIVTCEILCKSENITESISHSFSFKCLNFLNIMFIFKFNNKASTVFNDQVLSYIEI